MHTKSRLAVLPHTPSAALVLALALGLGGCAASFKANGPLEFEALPYQSTAGTDWPAGTVSLPGIQKIYGLHEAPTLTYVELNPEGAQTLIFIHGLGSNLKFWRYQLDAFATKGYHVLAIDMVGYGKSSKPASFPYTMEAMADVVREFKNAMGVDRPVLVGHSMGGQTAMSYAIRFPEELSALVLTAPAGFEEFANKEKVWFRSVFSVALIKYSSEEGIWGAIRKNNFYRWQPDYEWLIEERVRLVRAREFEQYAYANVKSVHGLTNTDFIRSNLDKIGAPTLIVFGEMDRLIPNQFMHGGPTRTIMEFGHRGIQGSELVGLEACGHMVQMDCSAEYNDAVGRFLAAIPAAGRGGPPATPTED